MKLSSLIKPVYAHCDLPCGVYDPAQARIEAQSMLAIVNKYDALDEHGKIRAVMILEQRAELVKQHLWILWTDYFKPPHLEQYPDLHDLFWRATKQAGACKHSPSVAAVEQLIVCIDEIDDMFQATKRNA